MNPLNAWLAAATMSDTEADAVRQRVQRAITLSGGAPADESVQYWGFATLRLAVLDKHLRRLDLPRHGPAAMKLFQLACTADDADSTGSVQAGWAALHESNDPRPDTFEQGEERGGEVWTFMSSRPGRRHRAVYSFVVSAEPLIRRWHVRIDGATVHVEMPDQGWFALDLRLLLPDAKTGRSCKLSADGGWGSRPATPKLPDMVSADTGNGMHTSPSTSPQAGSTSVLELSELCDRFSMVPTAAINDVLRTEGLLSQVLPPTLRGLDPSMRLAGAAFTIKGSKSLKLDNEMTERAAMLEAIPADSICVWDTSGDDESAQWGEVMTLAAQRAGCRGTVVDGGVRDTDKVLGLNFPVFCRYRTSNGMLGRFRMSDWQVPVRIGGVTIRPGDLVVGDADGVIVVPRPLAAQTLLAAEKIAATEIEIKNMIDTGASPREVVDRGGYF